MYTDKKLVINKEIVLRKEDEDAFLYDPDTGGVSVINATGIIVWEGMTQGKELHEILNDLKKEFPDISETDLKNDCDAFIKNLQDLHYIEK
ncbi:MAG: PqqD family protein [Candidatus Ancaeobacter aquaticus]|nr:PqqD family protein [Candidatus Ancaeobacter aquaticus]